MKITKEQIAGWFRSGGRAAFKLLNAGLVMGGIGLIGFGSAQVYEPAAFVIVGSILLWLGLPDK